MTPSKPIISRTDLFSLRLLLTAVEEGNLARTAARENIAISGVSRRITDLEQRWGVQLLHRHDRGVSATAAAEAILTRLQQIFLILEDALDEIAAFGSGTRGLIRIHANMTAVAGDLASHLAQFSAHHPSVEVELEETTSLDTIQAVRTGRCDIGIVSDTLRTDGLESIPWMDDELVAVLPVGHQLTGTAAVRFEDILDYPFIAMQHQSALQLLYRAKAAELERELDERAHVTSFATAKSLVAAGCGLSILPQVAIGEPENTRISIRPLCEPWAQRKVSICVKSKDLTPLQKTFINMLCGSSP